MPIYEYFCNQCKRYFSYLFLNKEEIRSVHCKFCHSLKVKRILSSFSVHESEESRIAGLDSAKTRDETFYKDSRNIGLRAKKRIREMGVDLGSKMDEIVERGRTGKILDDQSS